VSERDSDFEFDFFEEEPRTTEAAAQTRTRLPGRSPGPRRSLGPPHGAAPILRLLALVIFVIFLVLVLALLVQSCASASKQDAYADYMENVQTIAQQSAGNGRRVVNVLTTAGLTVQQIQNRLRGIADQERQNLSAAQGLDPPGQLRDEHEYMLTSLGLRVSGVSGLAQTFQQTADSTDDADAALLVAQANRLIASDVVWADLFKALTVQQDMAKIVLQLLDPNGVHHHRRARGARGLAQELRLAPVALDQLHARHPEQRQDQAGQPGAAAEIEHAAGAVRHMRRDLAAIEDVAAPGVGERARADQVDRALPAPQQLEIGAQALQCFT